MYFGKIKEQKKTAVQSFFFLRQVRKIKITCHLVREGMLFRKQYKANEIEISKLTS